MWSLGTFFFLSHLPHANVTLQILCSCHWISPSVRPLSNSSAVSACHLPLSFILCTLHGGGCQNWNQHNPGLKYCPHSSLSHHVSPAMILFSLAPYPNSLSICAPFFLPALFPPAHCSCLLLSPPYFCLLRKGFKAARGREGGWR